MRLLNILIVQVVFSFFSISAFPQLKCKPLQGDKFNLNEGIVNIRETPFLNGEIVIQLSVKESDYYFFNCLKDNMSNDFVIGQLFISEHKYGDFGINPNLHSLYNVLISNKKITDNFKLFYDKMSSLFISEDIYESIKNEKWFNTAFENFNIYDYKSFMNTFYKYDKNQNLVNIFFKLTEDTVYVHNTKLNTNTPSVYANRGNYSFFKEKFEEELFNEKCNYCRYTKFLKRYFFIQMLNSLIDSEEYYKLIIEINTNLKYFKETEEINTLEFYKMIATKYDNNNLGSLEIGKQLINKYETNSLTFANIPTSRADIGITYGVVIHSCLVLGQYHLGLMYSKKSIANKELYYSQQSEFHFFLLLNTNQKTSGCSFLNNSYLNGDENARSLYLEHCE